jgi:transposase InsO family protein
MSSQDRADKIALFRYGIIAPVLHESTQSQSRYFKEMSHKVYEVPPGEHKTYNWKTFKSWLRDYRIAGFDGLKPKTRSDKGQPRIIDDQLQSVIIRKFDQFPSLKISGLYRMLVDEGAVQSGSPCENAVRKFILDHDLKPKPQPPQPRKKFEKPHINELWLSDFMHGLRLKIDGVRRKLFLCGIIDDHSRLIVGASWSLQENTQALEGVLKNAILAYGLPKILYCDNGAVFASAHLQQVCARIGVALVHSKPYDSPSRGKIERFWRTVREGFLPLVSTERDYSLEQFNSLFAEWLDKQYHKRLHHGILETPMDRFIADLENTSVRRLSREEVDLFFFQAFERLVKNDATVSLNSVTLEVPAKYIGATIELRHPTSQPNDVWIYENGLPVVKVKPVDVHFNGQSPIHGIHFSLDQQEE